MKKQTISKIAAVALAAMTVVPMFGVTASADVTLDEGTMNNGYLKQAYGTANKAEWQLTSVTETVYTVEEYEISGGIKQYRLKEKSKSTDHYNPHDTTARDIKTPSDSTGVSTSKAPWGLIFYAYADKTPADYSDPVNKDGVKDILDKAKQDSIDDRTKVDKALAALNKELSDFGNAKKTWETTPNRLMPIKKVDGTTVYVNQDAGAVTYTAYQNSNGTGSLGSYTDPTTSPSVTIADVTGTANDKLVYSNTTSLAKDTEVKFYSYVYSATATSVPLTDVTSNLGSTYIKLNADGTTIEAVTVATAGTVPAGSYKIINGGEVVPSQNPDGSGSSGTATPGTNTGVGTGINYYTDYSVTPNAVYCWYSTARPGFYYKDGTTAQYAAYAVTGAYGTAMKYGTTTVIDYRTTASAEYPYVSSVPNRYYKTAEDAVADAKNHGYTNPTAVNYYSIYNNPYGYMYGYSYGYTGTTVKDTSAVTIGNYKGWTYVTRYINIAKAGTAYNVSMNSETEIPSSVLKALKGKNVTINFKFNSGAVLSINGNNISSTEAINTNIRYVKNVPSTLVKKAVKSNSGVSSAQFSVSGGTFSASASVTVKFNTNRAGCSAKLYRYNANTNSLSVVSTSSVNSNGNCTFSNVNQGGDYVIVLS